MNFSQKLFWLIFLFISGIFFWLYFSEFRAVDTWETPLSFFSETTEKWETNRDDIFDSKKIREAKKMIVNEYYHFSEKSKEEIENSFITSLVSTLGDKHSSYFPPKEASDFKDTLRGDFEGIGAVIDEHPRGVKIQKVLKNSPAEKSGMKNGDIVISANDTSLAGMTTEQAVDKIRWPKGTIVTLKYLRGDDAKENIQQIVREKVIIPSTDQKILSGSIGYLEVAYFGEHTTRDFRQSFDQLVASGAKGVILDFRNNPGWYLDSAVEILSTLLPRDTVAVITRENDPRKNDTLYTHDFLKPNTTIPLIILVNSLSASASEIVAWALQDHGRAIVVGEKTYGKWSVQVPFSLSDGSMMKLTVGRWYTPKNRGIDGQGISPDITIIFKDEDYKNLYDRQLEWAQKIIQDLIEKNTSLEKLIESLKNTSF